jgi:oligopeptide/dipeptide ABC transporter ATP-binding protein
VTTTLEVNGVSKSFPGRDGAVQALADVSLGIGPGETLGLVGESGCGKSTLAGCIQGLIAPDRGEIRLGGETLHDAGRAERRALRRRIGLVHQNPYSALDPKMRIDATVAEPLVAALGLRGGVVRERVEACLAAVDLPAEFGRRYPHQLSGGQRQRVAIARAIALAPDLLILDEPTAALDVSVQARILNLLKKIQAETGIGYLFITHNLAVVDYMARRVLVMYRGRVVEEGPAAAVFAAPAHPYTAALLAAVPRPDPAWRAGLGAIPPMTDMGQGRGCAYAGRCPRRISPCDSAAPALRPSPAGGLAACFNPLGAGSS